MWMLGDFDEIANDRVENEINSLHRECIDDFLDEMSTIRILFCFFLKE